MAESKPLLPVPGMTPEMASSTSASIDPFAAFPEAQAALSKTTLMPSFLETPAGRGEAPAPAPAPADAFAGFPEAPTPGAPVADPFASFPVAGQTRGYDLAKLKTTDASTLAKDKAEFNPIEFLTKNEEALLADPAALQKVQDAYEEREKEKMTAGQFAKAILTAPFHPIESAKTAGTALAGVPTFLGELLTAGGKVVSNVGAAAGAASAGDKGETAARLAEVSDAFGAATQRWANLLDTKLSPEPTNIRERMFRDSEYKKKELAAAAGNSDFSKMVGTSAEELGQLGIIVHPEAVQKMETITDPLFLIPIGAGVGVVSRGGKFLLAKTAGEAAAKTFAELGNAILERGVGGAVGGVTKAAGSGIEKIGSLATKLNELASKVPFTGSTTGGVKVAAKVAGLAGQGIEAVGRGVQALAPAAGAVGIEALKGATEATALSIPLFIGSTPEEREGLLAMVAAGGALRGGGTALGLGARVAGRATQDALAKRVFESADRGPVVDSPYYGTDQKLDQAHAEQQSKLTPGQQSVLNWTREFFRDAGVEVYALDNQTFQNHVPQVGGAAAAEGFFTHRGERIAPDGSRQPVIQLLLNGDTNGLGHELYHAFKSLDPAGAAALETHISKTWHPVEQQWISDQYNAALNGGKPRAQWEVQLDKKQILEEAAAEVFGRVFDATDLDGVVPSVQKRAALFASKALETMGFPLAGKGLPSGPGVSALGIRPSISEHKVSQDFLKNLGQRVKEGTLAPAKPIGKPIIAGELAPGDIQRRPATGKPPTVPATVPAAPSAQPAPAPRAPAAPAPAAPRNIRVTPKEQLDYAAKRSQVTNSESALADAQKLNDRTAVEHVEAINASMEAGHGVEITHKGVVREGGPTPEKPVGRGERRSEQEAAYVAEALGEVPETIREQHQKVLFGTRWQKTGKSGQQLTARSLDKALANIKVSADMAAEAKVAIPYEVDAAGKLTESGWSEAVQDLKNYWANQDRGFRGDGEALVRPKEDIGVSLPPEDPRGPVAKLSPDRTDFLNLVQGLNIPEAVTRQTAGKIPGNVKGQLLAELQGRTPEKPSVISPDDIQRQTYKPIEGAGTRDIAEVNPLRNELRAAGAPVGRLIEVTENVNLKNIETVIPRPDVPGRGGSTDITRSGFSVSDIKGEVARRLDEKRKAGIPITEVVRKKTQQEAEFAIRNPRRMGEGEAAGFFSVKPSEEVRGVAEVAAKAAGVVDYKPSTGFAPLNEGLSKRLADAYEAAKSNPSDPAVKASYDALIGQTEKQGQAILDAGYTVEPFTGTGEPYKSSSEMVADVRDNKHLFFLKTEGAFEGAAENPMLRPATLVEGQVANDVFRWVHDFFGHAKEGYQFGPRGEFNAWKSHSEMFTPEAQGALAAETLAQNSWVNFGKHLRDEAGNVVTKGQPGYVDAVNRPFAEQKNVLIPDTLIEEARAQAGKFSATRIEDGEAILGMNVEEWVKATQGFKGGLTPEAYRLGLGLTDRADLNKLLDFRSRAEAAGREAMAAGDFDTAMPLIMKAQFFREAWEAAQGTASAKKGLQLNAEFKDTKPPFLAEGESFSPTTAAGKKLAEKGYDFEMAGELGNRTVFAGKDGIQIGYTSSRQLDPKSAELSMTHLDKPERGQGVAEAMYRELFSQLQKDGVELIEGTVVAPEPLALRNKIFGGFDKLEAGGRPTTLDEALIGTNLLRKGVSVPFPGVDVINRIRPEQSFSPSKAKTEKSKYTVAKGKTPAAEAKPTGWILPDAKFVSLDTAYHQDWLADNHKQLNTDFGTDFGSASLVEERLKAINSGFVRIRELNGATHIELGQKFYKGDTRAAIEDQVLNRAEDMDRLQVTLLDKEGQVVDSVAAKLFDSETPREDAKAVLDSLKTGTEKAPSKGPSNIARARALGEGSFSVKAKGESLPGFEAESADAHENNVRAHVSEKRREHPEAILPTYSRNESGTLKVGKEAKPIVSKIDYDLSDTPVAKAAAKGMKGQAREEAVTDAYAKGLEKLYTDEAAKNPDILAGAKWYSTARARIKKLFGDDSKFFCELLGATSAQTPVDVNYRTAVDAFNLFKQGAYDKQIAQYRKGKAAWEAGRVKSYIEATGNETPNRGQFLDWWIEKYNLKPRKSNGTLFGANSRQVLRVLDGSWIEEVQGPKTPNFTGNLAGTTFDATIDVWASRTLHRIGNEGETGRWRILPESEQGIADADFHLAQAAFRKAASALGMKPDALQAIVWFAEKDRWQKNGWTGAVGGEKSDFNVHLSESEKLPSGLIRKKEAQLGINPEDIKKR
jgi:hypothetical protein